MRERERVREREIGERGGKARRAPAELFLSESFIESRLVRIRRSAEIDP